METNKLGKPTYGEVATLKCHERLAKNSGTMKDCNYKHEKESQNEKQKHEAFR